MQIGKRIGNNIYLHKSVVYNCSDFAEHKLAIAREKHSFSWNVLKYNNKEVSNFSLLRYQNFKTELFPELLHSSIFRNWRYSSKRSYRASNNPKILHRKEFLISIHNKQFLYWLKISKSLDELGAFDCPKMIGNKRNWMKILKQKGLDFHSSQTRTFVY